MSAAGYQADSARGGSGVRGMGGMERPAARSRNAALRRRSLLLSSTALLLVVNSSIASAACVGTCWIGTTSTDWFVSTNWTPPAVPDATTNVVIDQGSPNANPSIGINGTSNAAASAVVEIGDISGQTGLVTLSTTNAHPASWTITGNLAVGEGGTGTINISNAATMTNTLGQATIGTNGTGVGTVTVDGAGTLWNEQNASSGSVGSAPIVVGNSGTGRLTITNGAMVETTGN